MATLLGEICSHHDKRDYKMFLTNGVTTSNHQRLEKPILDSLGIIKMVQ